MTKEEFLRILMGMDRQIRNTAVRQQRDLMYKNGVFDTNPESWDALKKVLDYEEPKDHDEI